MTRWAGLAALGLVGAVATAAVGSEVAPSEASVRLGEVVVEARVQPGEATIGDVLSLEVVVEAPPEAAVGEPTLRAAPAPFELSEAFALVDEEMTDGGRVRRTFRTRLTTFEIGEHALPATEIVVQGADGEVRVETPAVGLVVRSVLAAEQQPILAPAKGLLPWSVGPSPWLLVAVAALVAALVAIALWLRGRRGAAPEAETGPSLACDERARRELEELLAGPLAAPGRDKEFFISLSEIVRRYLSERFAFDALEMTSDELQRALGRRCDRVEVGPTLARLLEIADLAKFARARPAAPQRRTAVEAAFALVERTRPVVSSLAPGERTA